MIAFGTISPESLMKALMVSPERAGACGVCAGLVVFFCLVLMLRFTVQTRPVPQYLLNPRDGPSSYAVGTKPAFMTQSFKQSTMVFYNGL